jgi:hypothetical protein
LGKLRCLPSKPVLVERVAAALPTAKQEILCRHARYARDGAKSWISSLSSRMTLHSVAATGCLLEVAAEVHLFDNSEETADGRPHARRVMRMKDRIIVAPPSLDELLRTTPEWAKPVVVAALKVNQATFATRRNRGR